MGAILCRPQFVDYQYVSLKASQELLYQDGHGSHRTEEE